MTFPEVTEVPLPLEAVTRDSFGDPPSVPVVADQDDGRSESEAHGDRARRSTRLAAAHA